MINRRTKNNKKRRNNKKTIKKRFRKYKKIVGGDDSDIVTDPVISNYSIQHRDYINSQYKKYKAKNFDMTICDALVLYQMYIDNYINGLIRKDPKFMKIKNQEILLFFNKIVDTIDNYFLTKAPRITQKDNEENKNIVYRGERKLCPNGLCRVGLMQSYTSTTGYEWMAREFVNKATGCCLYGYVLDVGTPYIDVDDLLSDIKGNCGVDLLWHFREKEYLLPRGIKLSSDTELFDESEGVKVFLKYISYDENYIRENPINFLT